MEKSTQIQRNKSGINLSLIEMQNHYIEEINSLGIKLVFEIGFEMLKRM